MDASSSSRTESEPSGDLDPRLCARVRALGRRICLGGEATLGPSGTFIARQSPDSNDPIGVGYEESPRDSGDAVEVVAEVRGLDPPAAAEGSSTSAAARKGKAPADPDLVPAARGTVNPYLHFLSGGPGEMARFRRTYQIPDDVVIEPYTEQRLVFSPDYVIFPLMAITEGGVRFPLHPFLRGFLDHYQLTPCQLTTNFYRVINSAIALVRENGLRLADHELFLMYIMGHNAAYARYYLSTRPGFDQLVARLTDSDKWGNDYVKVSGNFEFGPADEAFDWLDRDRLNPRRCPVPRVRGSPDVTSKTKALKAGGNWDRLIALLSCPRRDAPTLLGYNPQYKGFTAQKARVLVPTHMAPRVNLRDIIKRKEEEAKLRSAGIDPSYFRLAPEGSKKGAPGTVTVGEALEAQASAIPAPLGGISSAEPPAGSLVGRGRKAGGPSHKRKRGGGASGEEAINLEGSQDSPPGDAAPVPFAPLVEKPSGEPLSAADSLEEDKVLGRAVLGMTCLPRDMDALPHSRAENNTLFFYYLARAAQLSCRVCDDQTDLLASRAEYRGRAKAAEAALKAAEDEAERVKADAEELQSAWLAFKAEAEDEKRKLTADLAVAEMERKRAADALEQLERSLPGQLEDAEKKGYERAAEDLADDIKAINAEAEVEALIEEHPKSFILGVNAALTMFDVPEDDPRRAQIAVPPLVLSDRHAQAAERVAQEKADAASSSTLQPDVI